MKCTDNTKTKNDTTATYDNNTVPSPTLMAFGRQHGLRLKRTEDDQWGCLGKAGGIFSCPDDSNRLLMAMNTSDSKSRWWFRSVIMKIPAVAAATAKAAIDSCFTFDPQTQPELTVAAIKSICVPRKRKALAGK